jgi:hypothetical protein
VAGEHGIDELQRIKVSMSSADFQDFLRINHISANEFEEAQSTASGTGFRLVVSSHAASLPTAQLRRNPEQTINIGDIDHPKKSVTLYIIWFTK